MSPWKSEGAGNAPVHVEGPEEELVPDLLILNRMAAHGGSFVRRLGVAGQFADKDNLDVIKAGWPVYWANYRQMVVNDLTGITATD
jgi:hypothetical protein